MYVLTELGYSLICQVKEKERQRKTRRLNIVCKIRQKYL